MIKKKQILNDVIEFELLLQEAIDKKIHINNYDIRKKIVNEFLRQEIGRKSSVGEEEAKQFFDENKADIERIAVAHILF